MEKKQAIQGSLRGSSNTYYTYTSTPRKNKKTLRRERIDKEVHPRLYIYTERKREINFDKIRRIDIDCDAETCCRNESHNSWPV